MQLGGDIILEHLHNDSIIVNVVGVRRKIDLGLLQDDKPAPGEVC